MQAGYSFAASTVLATWLWTRLTSAKVLVTLITDDISDQEAIFLQKALSDLGAHVSLRQVLLYNILCWLLIQSAHTQVETNISCVLMAQVCNLSAINIMT